MGTRRRASARFVSLAVLLSVAAAPAASLAQTGPADFASLTMEQLMEVELVQSAARHPQALREAPSAVTVVTREEIERQGYRTLADVLAALPSFYVTYDRNYSYVGVRGFGRPGDYNTRVLVLVNGARVNDNVYEGVYVGHEFLVGMEMVERVEVVRGPAASLYGNSALFAVVNVVTRRGAQMQGGAVSASAGSFGTFTSHADYGGKTKGGLDYVLGASVLESAGQDHFYGEYAGGDEGDGWVRGRDGEVAQRSFASLAWRGLALHGAQLWRRKEVPTGAYGTVFGDPDSRTWDAMRQLTLQYEREAGRASVFGRVQHQQYDYRGQYPYSAEGLWIDSCNGRWWRAEAGASLPVRGRHVLTFGIEGQLDARQDQVGRYVGVHPELDVRDSGARWGAYAQEELRLGPLTAHFGLRHDGFEGYRQRTSPRLALVHQSAAGTVKLLYGSAFRAPNEYERRYFGDNDALRPETIRTLEAIWERSFGADTRVTASVFQNRISRLITLTGEENDLSFFNAGQIDSHGIELAGEWRRQGLRGRASYGWQVTREKETGAELTNSPRHTAKLGLDVPLASGRAWAGLGLRYTSHRLTLAGSRVGASTVADLTLRAPRLVKGVGLEAAVRNLLDARHADPGSEEHRQDALAQDGRALRVQMSWSF